MIQNELFLLLLAQILFLKTWGPQTFTGNLQKQLPNI